MLIVLPKCVKQRMSITHESAKRMTRKPYLMSKTMRGHEGQAWYRTEVEEVKSKHSYSGPMEGASENRRHDVQLLKR